MVDEPGGTDQHPPNMAPHGTKKIIIEYIQCTNYSLGTYSQRTVRVWVD